MCMRFLFFLCFSFCIALFFPYSSHAAEQAQNITPVGVYVYTNVERYYAGLPLVERNQQLDAVAERKARDIVERQYFAHESPDGVYAKDVAKEEGYSYISLAENLALGAFDTNKEIVQAWMKSSGHRENILTSSFSDIGVAVLKGEYNGFSVWVAVQVFGVPASACTVPSEDLKKEIDTLERVLVFVGAVLDEKRNVYVSGMSSSEYKTYQSAVRIYNEYVARQKKSVDAYNTQVDVYNQCIAEL